MPPPTVKGDGDDNDVSYSMEMSEIPDLAGERGGGGRSTDDNDDDGGGGTAWWCPDIPPAIGRLQTRQR